MSSFDESWFYGQRPRQNCALLQASPCRKSDVQRLVSEVYFQFADLEMRKLHLRRLWSLGQCLYERRTMFDDLLLRNFWDWKRPRYYVNDLWCRFNKHSVEISWFFYHSYFTWNQFRSLEKCEICLCLDHILEALKFDFNFLRLKCTKLTEFRAPKMSKTAIFRDQKKTQMNDRKSLKFPHCDKVSLFSIFHFWWNYLGLWVWPS